MNINNENILQSNKSLPQKRSTGLCPEISFNDSLMLILILLLILPATCMVFTLV